MTRKQSNDGQQSLFHQPGLLELFGSELPPGRRARGASSAWQGGYSEPQDYECAFMERVERFLTPKMTPAMAREERGTFVYVVLAPQMLWYERGPSAVKYIGFTGNTNRRYAAHEKLSRGDRVRLLDLGPHLRVVKHHNRSDWKPKTSRELDAFAKQAEAAFIWGFEQLLGSLPESNLRHEPLTHEGRFLTSIFFAARGR